MLHFIICILFSNFILFLFCLFFRHRKSEDDEMSGGSRCCFGFMVFIAQILLHGVVGLVLFWVIQYHSKPDKAWPFSWKTDPELEFNLHPFLMIMGFIYFTGQGNYYVLCSFGKNKTKKTLSTIGFKALTK